jgi:hypothetical protein
LDSGTAHRDLEETRDPRYVVGDNGSTSSTELKINNE